MNSDKSDPDPRSRTSKTPTPNLLLCAALGASVVPAGAWELATNMNFRAEAQVKQGYDDNVYLQNQEPNRALVPNAVSPHVGSSFTTITPKIAYDYRPNDAFGPLSMTLY